MSSKSEQGGVLKSLESQIVIVLTTLGGDADAVWLARTLVEERLAACVNILPAMTSVYRWEGDIPEDREQQLIIKTTARQVRALEARLGDLHPYEIPEFLVIRVSEGSAAYLQWVEASTGPKD
jgi:periplasmic divalent cation tolerance protein